MNELKEAITYAAVNGGAIFAIYTGSAVHFGESITPAVTSGAAVGLLAFGSYLVKEHDQVTLDLDDVLPANQKRMTKARQKFRRITGGWVPKCVRRHGMFRLI